MLHDVTILNLIAISIGAVPGALSRYYITEWCKQVFGQKFPYGTFLINVTGCFMMGLFITLVSGIKNFPIEARLMVATGFLGAYTTFSTYEFDTVTLWRRGDLASASFYWAGSAILGVIAVLLGIVLAQFISN